MDMKLRTCLRLSLLTVFLASCASGNATVPPEPLATAGIEVTTTASAPTQLPTETVSALPAETLAPTTLPIATSRGPNLEATDPTTVKMASGGLQFVEFFEFW